MNGGILRQRREVLASKRLRPYTSQQCSGCGFTAQDNRRDHRRGFFGGTIDTSDGKAAKMILKRFRDREIKPGMNTMRIKTMLDCSRLQITGPILGARGEADDRHVPPLMVGLWFEEKTVIAKAESEPLRRKCA